MEKYEEFRTELLVLCKKYELKNISICANYKDEFVATAGIDDVMNYRLELIIKQSLKNLGEAKK